MINNLKKKILCLSAIALFAVSCTQTKEIKATVLDDAAAPATADIANPPVAASNSGAQMSGQAMAAPAAGIGGTNPEHGKPGHRCDIAVGAPLNSPVASAPAPQNMTVSSAPAPVANPQPVQTVAAGMNPAHGQAGHRCDIAVGAPLNSPAPSAQQ